MTAQMGLVLAFVAGAAVLFVTGRLRMDAVALLVLVGLALTGLVTPAEALSGFSNPAVVTVWAMFVISGGLWRTGVASALGVRILRLAGTGERRLVVTIMASAGVMSAFMNNVGVAALLLPVVMDMARRTGRPASKLLMPLAYGCLLGGLTTLIGTPPNILVSDSLRDYGLRPFGLFDFTPVGAAVLVTGIGYMALAGLRRLPVRDLAGETTRGLQPDWRELYDLGERLFLLRVPADSALDGRSLTESRLGAALGLNAIGVLRHGETHLAPPRDFVLRAGDRLVVQGRLDRLGLLAEAGLELHEEMGVAGGVEVEVVEVRLASGSAAAGRTLRQLDFRRRFGLNVVAVQRDGRVLRSRLEELVLEEGDVLLAQGRPAGLEALREHGEFLVSEPQVVHLPPLHERLTAVRVPPGSGLAGRTLAESRLRQLFGLSVLAIVRNGRTLSAPSPEVTLLEEDVLLGEGDPAELDRLRALERLEVEAQPPDLRLLESEGVGLVEAVLSPHSGLAGRTLREIHFREKYGLNVLAIWRGGRAHRSALGEMALRFGDALLVYGRRERLRVLGGEPDFVVLAQSAQELPRRERAALAVGIMALVLVPVTLGVLPIAIAAVMGAALMVVTGCLTMEEAYRFIEWRAVFLIAGLLPLGIAMEQTGTARFLAQLVVGPLAAAGSLALLGGLYLLTVATIQVIPGPAAAVLMAPIALNTAQTVGLSPHALMMVVALSASASFLSPVAHPANLLVMGPGGYTFRDYIRQGLPMTLVSLATVLLVLPVVWPLSP